MVTQVTVVRVVVMVTQVTVVGVVVMVMQVNSHKRDMYSSTACLLPKSH